MSEERSRQIIEGYSFADRELAEKAREEMKVVAFIRERTNLKDPSMVYQVYEKVIHQNVFQTPVGIGYLRELQNYLYQTPSIEDHTILPIPVEEMVRREVIMRNSVEKEEKKEKVEKKWGLGFSIAMNFILAGMVVAMFLITATSSHPNILNYKEKILNEYAGWEQELKEREQEIRQKEQEWNKTLE